MPRLRHEAREFPAGKGSTFGLATLDGLANHERLDGPSELKYVIYAETHQEAMQRYYDREGWGQYDQVPRLTDRPYAAEDLDRQMAEYPEDAELRRVNVRGS